MALVATVLLLFAPCSTLGQTVTIRGRVVNSLDETPLPGANIFISNTTLGAAADEDGRFQITFVPAGQNEVVASMIGFIAESVHISVTDTADIVVNFRLNEMIFKESEALVEAKRPRNWKRNLERFTRELLGWTDNGRNAKIVNPYVLTFDLNSSTGRLTATASAPLHIENPRLGYDMVFVLDDFEVTEWPYTIRYSGRPRYKPRTVRSKEDEERIAKHRLEAYRGSFRHFLSALSHDQLDDAGFVVRSSTEVVTNPDEISLLPRIEADSLVARGRASYETLIYAPDILHIVYTGESEPARYRKFVRNATGRFHVPKQSQTSYLSFERGVIAHTTGYLYEPYVVTTIGYWTWERLADTLPRDYEAENVRISD